MASPTKQNQMPTDFLAQVAELLRQKQPEPITETTINIKLNDNNYAIWSRTAQLVLLGRGRTGYITGKTVTPDPNDTGYKTWEQMDGSVRSLIHNSMEPEIAAQFILCPNAKELWDKIAATYHNGDQYYWTVQGIWREIDFRQPQSMKCPDDRKTYNLEKQEDRVFAFLWGLDGKFDPIKRDLLKAQQSPTLEEAYNVVRREDRRLAGMTNQPPGRVGVVAKMQSELSSSSRDGNGKWVGK
ncbi:hypothetical protein K2173_013950 [Erythroxylum novogranatense]|uniref:Retrotransposon Copia-like N-terminal domain-containing protein n=1 Tax=Erythroxylum novogranatense TaxID=1862640 RepID=A0AAV8SDC2_9ROSI|nr:hypothetical protein K2173_013950 [Erythroxylum novogranatense]